MDCTNFPNLPLMKISAYHKAQGHHVEWCTPLLQYDLIYKSKVFDDTYSQDDNTVMQADEVICGGTGYGLDNKLPHNIEHIYPDYSLYPQYKQAYGFLTRGCPRACAFCIVSEKEGRKSQHVADLSEFWRGQKEIKLLDPNLLACKEHERLLEQLTDSGAYIDYTQGLDIRFIIRDNIDLINRQKIKMLHFAWDNPREDLTEHFKRFQERTIFKSDRIKTVYVLTNFGSTIEEDLYRIYTLRDLEYGLYSGVSSVVPKSGF